MASQGETDSSGSAFGVPPAAIHFMQRELCDWAIAQGMIMTASDGSMAHASFALQPTPFPAAEFQRALDIQPHFNRLMHLVRSDTGFLLETLKNVARIDTFTGRLVHMLTDLQAKGHKDRIALAIHRNDYMLHSVDDGSTNASIKQIEINTISAGFSALGSDCAALHKHMYARYPTPGIDPDSIPKNRPFEQVAVCMSQAVQMYTQEFKPSSALCVLFVVQPNEHNFIDQRKLEYSLWDAHKIPTIRRSLKQVQDEGEIRDGGALLLDGFEVGLVYFRAGYTPADYPSESEWQGREKIEASRAVKSPNLPDHLSGCKKIQEVLAQPGAIERFISEPDVAQQLRDVFVGLYTLDNNEAGDKAAEMAMKNPDAYVLKPQREGGGNNFYGKEIESKLSSIAKDERAEYILMDRIVPVETASHLVRLGKIYSGNTVSELGIYGISIDRDGKEVENSVAGYLLRTKLTTTDDGGVSSGRAYLDSPVLT